MGRSGKMRRRAGRRFLAITSEGKFTIIETTTAACEFRMQVCLRHSSSTTLLLAKTLFFPPFILHPSRLPFPFPCQRDLSSARATTPPLSPSLPLFSISRRPVFLPGFTLLLLLLLPLVVDPNDVRGEPRREAELDK